MPRYLVIDTETSGLPLYAKKGEPPPSADAPSQPRLASFTAIATTPDLEIDEEMSISTLIKPDGWVMSEGATAVNSLTTEQCEAEGLPVRDVLAIYSEYIETGWVIVTFNAQFDTKVMRGELRRAGMPDLFERTLNICAMRAAMKLGVQKTGDKKGGFPKQPDVYRHFYGQEPTDQHTSFGDAKACLAIFRKLVEIGAAPEPSILYAKSHQAA